MNYQTLLTDRKGQVMLITLNRPDKRNALSRTLRDEIIHCLTVIESDDDVKAVVIAGSGSTFCAGFDLQEFQSSDVPFLASQLSQNCF